MRYIAALLMAILALSARGQLAVKTNLLYDATTSPNIGAEVRIGSRSTLNVVYGINAWTFSSRRHGDRQARHWVVMPEYRWWTCTPFNGHFIGVHALGGQLNAQNVSLPIPGGFFGGDNLTKVVRDERCRGWFAGAGVTYGYQWMLSRHWNLEAEIGAGYGHVVYDRFSCGECGVKTGSGNTNYLGVTKLGLSVMYLF